jgi:hypothetical protein
MFFFISVLDVRLTRMLDVLLKLMAIAGRQFAVNRKPGRGFTADNPP